MTQLFVTKPGQVVAVQDVGALPLTIFFDNWPGFPSIRAAITQLSFSRSGNYQFLHSLQDFIYVYIFGERIGEVSVGGLMFSEACQAIGGPSGPEQVSDFYDTFRISKYGKLLTLQVGLSGKLRVRGFLTASRMDIFDTQHQLGQFTLRLHTLPKETAPS